MLRTLRAPVVALLAITGSLALATPTTADERFDPSFDVSLTQSAPQTPSELTLRFAMPGGDLQLSTAVFYIPRDWGVARGEEIPVGARVGNFRAQETFGFFLGPCNEARPIEVELFNASLDIGNAVSFQDLDMQAPPDARGDGVGIPDYAEDKDRNGLPNVVDHYPDFLTAVYGSIRPIARVVGVAYSAPGLSSVFDFHFKDEPEPGWKGTPPILFQLLIFEPGTRLSFPDPGVSGLIADLAETGYPTLMVLQDFRNPDNPPGAHIFTGYCTPRETTISFAPVDGGQPLLVNPQAGGYGFSFVSVSKRDADGDGYENSLDTCPFDANLGDPRIQDGRDVDSDGIDSACDPVDDRIPQWNNTEDQETDGYTNLQDNCPLVDNGELIEVDGTWIKSPDHQNDRDFDDIGDSCDPNPGAPDGEALVAVKHAEVVIGDPSGSGGPPIAAACPQCYRPGDSVPDSQEEGGSGQLAVAIGLIGVGIAAAAIIVGSGTVYLLRRRRGTARPRPSGWRG